MKAFQKLVTALVTESRIIVVNTLIAVLVLGIITHAVIPVAAIITSLAVKSWSYFYHLI